MSTGYVQSSETGTGYKKSEGLSSLPKNDEDQVKKDGEWLQLFNGKNLEGWIPKVTGYKSGENPLNGFRGFEVRGPQEQNPPG